MGIVKPEIEAQTLAAMIEDKGCLDIGLTRLTKEYFTTSFYQRVLYRLRERWEADEPINPLILAQEMMPEIRANGSAWLMVKESLWTKASFEYYCDRLQEALLSRKLMSMCQNTMREIEEGSDINALVDDFETKLYTMSPSSVSQEIVTPKAHAERVLETAGKRMERKSSGGISTTYIKLNRALNGGFMPGQLVILAAKTGDGKTTMAMNLMRDIAITQKIPSLYVNTEMSDEQMDCRWAAILSADDNFNHYDIATGQLTEDQFKRLVGYLDRMHNSGFHSVTVPDLTITSLISIARRFKAKVDMRFLVVDYIGRMDTMDAKLAEHQVLKQITKKLKTLAQQLGITVIMIAQLTEDGWLEGAKAMKNEADLFCQLREMTQEESDKFLRQYNYVLVAGKNRDGMKMRMPLKFIADKLTFKGETEDELARAKQKHGEDNEAPNPAPEAGRGRGRRNTRQGALPYGDR